MPAIFIQYPTCSTCRKAKQFLEQHQITFLDRHIVNETPSVEELRTWISHSQINIDKLFNTSGQVYRQLDLKNKLSAMDDEAKLSLLASNGMLIKRPLLLFEDHLYVGFKEAVWKEII